MATADVDTGVYAIGNDNVPEVYRPFFDNGDWVLHNFTVYGFVGLFGRRDSGPRVRVVMASLGIWEYDKKWQT